MTRTLFLLGPPASGKSTLARHLTEVMGSSTVSIGDLLRSYSRDHEPVRTALADGAFVSDDLVFDLVSRSVAGMDRNTAALVFDGLPRTLRQVDWLHEVGFLTADSVVIVLSASESQLRMRVRARSKQTTRADDLENPFLRRLATWNASAATLVARLQTLALVVDVDTENLAWRDVLDRRLRAAVVNREAGAEGSAADRAG